eukprot:scaffold344_cov130-Cylindrotheca_fusiformis.AAC.10
MGFKSLECLADWSYPNSRSEGTDCRPHTAMDDSIATIIHTTTLLLWQQNHSFISHLDFSGCGASCYGTFGPSKQKSSNLHFFVLFVETLCHQSLTRPSAFGTESILYPMADPIISPMQE